ncbi:MAG TPA: PHP domain-containing protein [Desulfobacteraceae bacterium]|nr:PHP domain-containing protein [Desulfobacteraceae bacterium]HPJ67338.1 PHP domain-containing protein [Desulfobacteraceae bacterium]HPQ28181.1 PHP domain-containing protein [Desulfobacteraceae bacterium]
MITLKADFHIHTCLSPCGDLDMTPKAIVENSLEKGLDLIAVCDHNSAENAEATIRMGLKKGLKVLPGLEVCSREEVHSLAIFESADQALKMQEIVYSHLKGTNRPEFFGDQVVANEFDEVEGFNDHLLIGASGLGLLEVIDNVHKLGGISIASHVDRPSFSVMSQLGFIPKDLPLDGIEISQITKFEEISAMTDLPVMTFSDAHFIKDIGRVHTEFYVETASLGEIKMALKGESGRKIGV